MRDNNEYILEKRSEELLRVAWLGFQSLMMNAKS